MIGHWKIQNHHYYGDREKTKYPPDVVALMPKPWVAVYSTPSYYDAKESQRFATQLEALQYALSGGKPLDLTNTER